MAMVPGDTRICLCVGKRCSPWLRCNAVNMVLGVTASGACQDTAGSSFGLPELPDLPPDPAFDALKKEARSWLPAWRRLYAWHP